MRFRLFSRFSLGIFLSLLLFLDSTFGSLMLGSLLMALKGSIFAGKMGMGGLLAMIYAASQNPNYGQTGRTQTAYTPISLSSLGKKRAVRSVDANDNVQVDQNSPPSLTEMMNREIIPDSDAVALLQKQFNETNSISNSSSSSNPAPVSISNPVPLVLNETHVHLSAEKLAERLNDTKSPVTQRVMRQVAILDQLSCLPKVICGMNTRAPSTKTNIINDYGYLIKFLFERDSDDDNKEDDDQDDDVEDDEDDDDDVYSRAEQLLRTAMSKGTKDAMSEAAALLTTTKNKVKKQKKKKKPSKNDDDEEDDDVELDDEEDEEQAISRAQLDDINSDDKLDDMAQDELVEEEPEMLRYVLTEMKQKMRKHKPSGYPDHSYLPGYDINSYGTSDRVTQLLNTDSSQAILNGGGGISSWYGKGASSGPYSDSKGVSYSNNKGVTFKWGPNEQNEEEVGFLGSLLPSFSFTKTAGTKGKGSTDDDFANDPFFAGFKRSMRKLKRQLRLKKMKEGEGNLKGEVEGQIGDQGQLAGQRVNSKFRRLDDYIAEKQDEIRRSDDPLTKYRVAEEVGRQAGSNRQCRLLFAKCPYEFTEIMSMIDNVKKLVTSSATVNDPQVQLKQNILGSATGSTSGSTSGTPVLTTNAGGSVVNLQTGNGGSPGITSISHQLENGDKVEIMLKIKPKESNVAAQKYQVIREGSPSTQIGAFKRPDPSVLAANKSLYEMKKAIQAIAKIHNETELKLNSIKEKQQAAQLANLLSSVGLASNSPNLNVDGLVPSPAGSKVKVNAKQEEEAGSGENDDNDNNSNSSSQQDHSSEENYSGDGLGRKPPTPENPSKPSNPNHQNSGPFIIDYSQQGTNAKPTTVASAKKSTAASSAKNKNKSKESSKEDEGSASEEDEEQDQDGEEESGEDQDQHQGDDHAPIRHGYPPNQRRPSPEMRYPGMGYGPGSQAHLYKRREQFQMHRPKPRPHPGQGQAPKRQQKISAKPNPKEKPKPKPNSKPAHRPNPTPKPANTGPFIIDYTKQGTNSYPHPPIAENHKNADSDSDSEVETSRVSTSAASSSSSSSVSGVRRRPPSVSLPPKPSPYRILKKRPRIERPTPKPKPKTAEEEKKTANKPEEDDPDSLESLRF